MAIENFKLYLKEVNRPPFVIINDFYNKAKNELISWVKKIVDNGNEKNK